MPALAAAADVSATGTMTGLATVQPPAAGAMCIPNAGPTNPEDFVCDFDTDGTFDLDEVGTGTYAGEFRLDWSIYTGSEPCAETTGTLTLTTADGTLDVAVEDSSRVCETADADVHEATFDITVLSGTGVFAGATGALSATGSLTESAGSGEYDAALDVTGMVTVPDPTPTPTPAPTDDAAPTASASAMPPAALPDTASATGVPMTGIMLVLAAALISSLGVSAVARRSA